MYKDTITLFNRYQDKQRNVWWYPTVLHDVNLNMDKASIVAKYGHESTDNAVLNVRYRIVDCNKTIGNKIWLPPKEWYAQPNDQYAASLTFTSGTNFDFFMLDEWEGGDGAISDSTYPNDEGFYGYMNRTQDFVFAITAVGGPYTVIPHFEIMGR